MTITTFPYRIDRWDADGISEHLADIDDLIVARAIYEAACKRSPGERITLRQGARVIEDSRKTSSFFLSVNQLSIGASAPPRHPAIATRSAGLGLWPVLLAQHPALSRHA